jgi:hypothetical protein
MIDSTSYEIQILDLSASGPTMSQPRIGRAPLDRGEDCRTLLGNGDRHRRYLDHEHLRLLSFCICAPIRDLEIVRETCVDLTLRSASFLTSGLRFLYSRLPLAERRNGVDGRRGGEAQQQR